MKKKNNNQDELRSEYVEEDPGKGVRVKYYESYKKTHNMVLLDPEVARVLPNDRSVNETLKSLIKVARDSTGIKKNSPKQKP